MTETRCRLAAKTLKDVVALAASAVPTRTNLDTLLNIMLTTEDGVELTAVGTDLATGVKATAPTGLQIGSEDQGFTVCVNGAKLAAFVATLPDAQPVEMTVSERALVMVCARSRGRFPLSDPLAYPEFPGTKRGGTLLTAMGERVGRALGAVLPFVPANEKARPALSGAYLEIKDGKLTTMGADGYIFAVYRGLDDGLQDGKTADVKRDATLILNKPGAVVLAEIARQAGESRVTLSLVGAKPEDATGLRLDAEVGGMNIAVYTRAMEGPYPAAGILSVLPQREEREQMPLVEATLPLLAAAVRRVSTFGTDTVFGTPIRLRVAGVGYESQAALTLNAAGAELGEGEDVLDCTAMSGEGDPLPEGEALTAGLGSRHILDALKAVRDTTGSERVFLGFRGPNAFTFNGGSTSFQIGAAPRQVSTPVPEPEPPPSETYPEEGEEWTADELDEFAARDEVADLSEV